MKHYFIYFILILTLLFSVFVSANNAESNELELNEVESNSSDLDEDEFNIGDLAEMDLDLRNFVETHLDFILDVLPGKDRTVKYYVFLVLVVMIIIFILRR